MGGGVGGPGSYYTHYNVSSCGYLGEPNLLSERVIYQRKVVQTYIYFIYVLNRYMLEPLPLNLSSQADGHLKMGIGVQEYTIPVTMCQAL